MSTAASANTEPLDATRPDPNLSEHDMMMLERVFLIESDVTEVLDLDEIWRRIVAQGDHAFEFARLIFPYTRYVSEDGIRWPVCFESSHQLRHYPLEFQIEWDGSDLRLTHCRLTSDAVCLLLEEAAMDYLCDAHGWTIVRQRGGMTLMHPQHMNCHEVDEAIVATFGGAK
jgi:hypothetical protein